MRRDCPDCGGALEPIRVLMDAERFGGTVAQLDRMQYAPAAARASIWNGRYPGQGTIRAHLCSQCGRVLLYAETAADALPLPGGGAQQENAELPRPAMPPEPEG